MGVWALEGAEDLKDSVPADVEVTHQEVDTDEVDLTWDHLAGHLGGHLGVEADTSDPREAAGG